VSIKSCNLFDPIFAHCIASRLRVKAFEDYKEGEGGAHLQCYTNVHNAEEGLHCVYSDRTRIQYISHPNCFDSDLPYSEKTMSFG